MIQAHLPETWRRFKSRDKRLSHAHSHTGCRCWSRERILILPTCSGLAGDEELPGVRLLPAAGGLRVTSEDKQTAPVFSGRPYHLALGKELQYFPDYVCTQTSAAGKLCNAERGGVGAREEGLEGGPRLHPAALGPSQCSCSPGGAADGLHRRCRSLGTATPEPRLINGLFIKHPDQNAYIRHPGNLITQPGFTSHTHTPFFLEASVRS